MQVLGDAQNVLTKEELLGKYRQDLERIIGDINSDIEPERVWQLRKIQKADLYSRGLQYLVPQFADITTVAYSAVGSPTAGPAPWGRDSDSDSTLDYIQNIYLGLMRKFVSLLGQRIANVQALPDDPNDEDSKRVTRMANTCAQILRSAWNIEVRSLELAYHLWKSSTTFLYTPYVADGYKYGYTELPQYNAAPAAQEPHPDEQPQPDEFPAAPEEPMQLPQVTDIQKFANGQVELHLINTMFVTVPFRVKELKDAAYLKYEYEEYKSKLRELHPILRKDPPHDDVSASDSSAGHLAAQIRDAAASPLGVPNPSRGNRWTYTRFWMQPHMFEMITNDAAVEELKRHFPNGIKITLVQNHIVELEEERLTDVWVACKPETSEFLIPDAYGDPVLQVQDIENDMLNIARLTEEAGIGFNFADVRVLHPEYFKKQRAMPNKIVPTLPPAGATLADGFYQVPPAQFSDQMLPWKQSVVDDLKTIEGLTDWVGGGGETTGTAHGDEIQKNAAMQQIITTWVYVRQAWAAAYQNGVKQMARYGAGMIRGVRQGDQGYESLVVDAAELQETGWHFEADPAFPMTTAEQRGTLMWLMSLGPDVSNNLTLFHPRNIDKMFQLFGWTGLYSPVKSDMEKAQAIIHELALGQPQQSVGPDGQPKLLPSIPADEHEDKHDLMAEMARAYLVDGPGLRLRKANEAGYQNILAWMLQHLDFQQQQNQPPPPPPPSPRMSISAKVVDLPPEVQQKTFEDFHLAPGTPPVQGKEGSSPAPVGVAPTAGMPTAPPPTPGMNLPAGPPPPPMAVQ